MLACDRVFGLVLLRRSTGRDSVVLRVSLCLLATLSRDTPSVTVREAGFSERCDVEWVFSSRGTSEVESFRKRPKVLRAAAVAADRRELSFRGLSFFWLSLPDPEDFVDSPSIGDGDLSLGLR